MSRSIILFFVIAAALIFTGACKGKTGPAKTEPAKAAKVAQPEAEEKIKIEDEILIYNKEGKRDPFASLLIKAQEGPKSGATPLESYDISTVKVIGVVWNAGGHFAEIVLPDGKAYTLREGMAIGLHNGKVQRITPNSIVIKESVKDYKGNIKSKETILKLREEEE
ncbi:MAG: hypothetical protein EPN94_03105 [Nitrospirae bacterium]|nr:MAG: hypothetical protein EPN94_03105 [Nitrospirota bacterium]